MFDRKCKCIKDTTIDKIVVGNFYKFGTENCTFKIMYDVTDKTFQVIHGNKEWFEEHFEIVG